MPDNLIRIKQLDQNQLSGFVSQVTVSTGLFSDYFVSRVADQTISGIKNFYTRPTVNGTGVLLTGEPATIIGNLTVNGNIINSGIADQFPAWTGARRYTPLAFSSPTSAISITGMINYFPFLVKKNAVNPVACVEMMVYADFNPKVDIGIYSGHYGFENAKLITFGSITGNASNLGIYRTTLNGTFNKGPYIVASMLRTGQGSTFKALGISTIREHFGINTGSPLLQGNNSIANTNILIQTGASLPQNIGSGDWSATSTSTLSPLVFLEY
jgi:hypothetical protein